MLKVLDTRTRIPPGCKKKKDHDIKFRYLRPIFILLTKRRQQIHVNEIFELNNTELGILEWWKGYQD